MIVPTRSGDWERAYEPVKRNWNELATCGSTSIEYQLGKADGYWFAKFREGWLSPRTHASISINKGPVRRQEGQHKTIKMRQMRGCSAWRVSMNVFLKSCSPEWHLHKHVYAFGISCAIRQVFGGNVCPVKFICSRINNYFEWLFIVYWRGWWFYGQLYRGSLVARPLTIFYWMIMLVAQRCKLNIL